jgi:hypothetical protein
VLRQTQDAAIKSWTAVCPLTIRNDAPGDLNVQRLLVQGQNLEVYAAGDKLWTNGMRMRFAGEERSSQITIERNAPELAVEPRKICDARNPDEKTFLKQSFSFLRSLTGV